MGVDSRRVPQEIPDAEYGGGEIWLGDRKRPRGDCEKSSAHIKIFKNRARHDSGRGGQHAGRELATTPERYGEGQGQGISHVSALGSV